jgi:hypothetical protein
MKSGKWKGKGK